MKVEVSEATLLQLNWMVSQAESVAVVIRCWTSDGKTFLCNTPGQFSDEAVWCPSEDWSQGGPIIERERVDLFHYHATNQWGAQIIQFEQFGPTPLIAAMRCFVASKLGDEVDVPEELL